MRRLRQKLEETLKEQWLSNWQMQQLTKSSSGDRIGRTIRKKPPEGYHMEQRSKFSDRTFPLEFRLVKNEQ